MVFSVSFTGKNANVRKDLTLTMLVVANVVEEIMEIEVVDLVVVEEAEVEVEVEDETEVISPNGTVTSAKRTDTLGNGVSITPMVKLTRDQRITLWTTLQMNDLSQQEET